MQYSSEVWNSDRLRDRNYVMQHTPSPLIILAEINRKVLCTKHGSSVSIECEALVRFI